MKKKKTKSLPKLKAELQLVFNQYIRLRDQNEPCICCNQYKLLQAGHYYAVKGYDGLRFNELNVHGECEHDNCWNESHLIGYGENLIDRIGHENLEILKQEARDYKASSTFKWSRSDLIEKIAYYKEKVKEFNN